MTGYTASNAPAKITGWDLSVAIAYTSNGWPAYLSNTVNALAGRLFGLHQRELTASDDRTIADMVPTTATAYDTAAGVAMLAEFADAMEAREIADARQTVTTYHVTRDSDRANSDMDAAMAHVDIVRTEVFADAVAGLLGYMIGEAQDLEALPVKLERDNWAGERARAIRAGMETVRTWSAESFAGGERWSRIHVTTRGLVFAITAVTR